MAYAAIASLSHTIDLLLNHHEDYVFPQFKDQIISLHKHTNFLQSFLEDFPDRAYNWEETIREISDRAEDIIELLLSDSLLKLKSTVGSSRSKFQKGKYDLHYGLDVLEKATEEMESIVNRVKGGRRTEAMGGSDEEVMKIISRLREGSYALEIIPIVGMGGIGKTTLAKNAYNHPLIVEHFQIRAWITISSDHSALQIIFDLLCFLINRYTGIRLISDDDWINDVRRILQCRRYLIVLDNIWSLGDWNSLKLIFPDTGAGSRIILTTRSFQLAKSTSQIHEMRFLDEFKTWNLFREKIFKGDPCPPQLESMGKEIARSCRGHRLSIEVVSGILAADQTEGAWKDVLDNIKIASGYNEILSLSYTYLPQHLRPCFLYLAIYPAHHEIHVSKLIKLWVAEGFLNQSEFKSFEESGEEHVEDLVQRNLVLVRDRKFNGRIKSITVHDLIHDLCETEAHKENFNHRAGTIHMKLYQSCRRYFRSHFKPSKSSNFNHLSKRRWQAFW